MILKFIHYARPDERFSPDTFKMSIGKPFNANVNDVLVGTGEVVGANVIEGGLAVEMVIDWPDESSVEAFLNTVPFSFKASDEEQL